MKKRFLALALALTMLFALVVPVGAVDTNALPALGETIDGFTVREVRQSRALDADVLLLEHEKTGAQVLYLANDDANRTFAIGFQTPASDTGVTHIFEHSTLSGSEKYPADIFFGLDAQVLKTFMNAYTFENATYYPLSSVSDAQLLKLADVYLDGVFHPLVLEDESAFETEGWRYELSSLDGELTYNGTVYSEMRGSLTLFERAYYNALRTLYPGSHSSAVAGGDPEVIPTLTHEELAAYHEAYYCPSNSLTVLYGDIDLDAYLTLLGSYFDEYDRQTVDLSDPDYTPISGYVQQDYQAAETGDPIAIYGIACEPADEDELFGLYALANLLNQSSSVFQLQMQEQLPVATGEVWLDLESREPTFSFAAENLDPDDGETFEAIARAAIASVAENGVSQDELDAFVADQMRSILTSSTTNVGESLIEEMGVCWPAWGDPMMLLDHYDFLTDLDQHFSVAATKKLAQTYLLDPARSARTMTVPDEDYARQKEAEQKQKLAAIKASMSEEELTAIVAATNAPTETDEELVAQLISSVNVTSVDELKQDLSSYQRADHPFTDQTIDSVRYLSASEDAGDVGLGALYFDVASLTDEQLSYLALYNDLQTLVPTQNYSQAELSLLLTRYMDSGTSFQLDRDLIYYVVSMTVLDDDIEQVFPILNEVLFRNDFSDTETLKALVSRLSAATKQAISSSPQTYLYYRMHAQSDQTTAVREHLSGLSYYTFLGEVASTLETDPQSVVAKLNEVQQLLQNKTGAAVLYAGSDAGIARFQSAAQSFFAGLPAQARPTVSHDLLQPVRNEAIVIGADVSFNEIVATWEQLGAGLTGSWLTTQRVLYDKLLIPQLRYNKGAYGVQFGRTRTAFTLNSYRDPQIKDTFDYFDALDGLLDEMELTQEDVDGYILANFCGYLDLSDALNHAYSSMANAVVPPLYDTNLILEQTLNTTVDQVKGYVSSLTALSQKGSRGTIGNESGIIANADLYDTITFPFGSGEVYLYADGQRVQTDVAPVMQNDRLLVPLRAVAEALGASVSWNEADESATITAGGKTLTVQLGSTAMTVDGTTTTLDVAPVLVSDRTMVPVRAIAEAFDRTVSWKTGCVVIE
jgi:Zn-dependent M16 (insulinase) family peptidase